MNAIASVNAQPTMTNAALYYQQKTSFQASFSMEIKTDTISFGMSGQISYEESMNIVVERAMDQLRSVVDDAREALGIPEGQVLDTSPEATAQRIVEFGLNAFNAWWRNHDELGEEDARKQFAAFIGGAIEQGINEARDILTALNALNPDVDNSINKTWELIQQQLQKFANGEDIFDQIA